MNSVAAGLAAHARRICFSLAKLTVIATNFAFAFSPDGGDIDVRRGGGDGSGFWLLLLIFIAPLFARQIDRLFDWIVLLCTTALPIGLGVYAFDKTPVLGLIGIAFGAFFIFIYFVSDRLSYWNEARQRSREAQIRNSSRQSDVPLTAPVRPPPQSSPTSSAGDPPSPATVIRERSDRAVHGRAESKLDAEPPIYPPKSQSIEGKPLSELQRTSGDDPSPLSARTFSTFRLLSIRYANDLSHQISPSESQVARIRNQVAEGLKSPLSTYHHAEDRFMELVVILDDGSPEIFRIGNGMLFQKIGGGWRAYRLPDDSPKG